MFLPISFVSSIQLSSSELKLNFEKTIKDNIKIKFEGICTKYGFIKPNSINIQKRSVGVFSKQHFNGHIKFELLCTAEVCNPIKGLVVEAEIKNKNALGLLAESSIEINDKIIPILDIIIPKKAAGIISEIDLENVNIGDKIYVMVLGKKYQLNDEKISIIGKAVKSLDSKLTDVSDTEKQLKFIKEGEENESDEEPPLSDIESGEDDDDSQKSNEEIDSDEEIPRKKNLIEEESIASDLPEEEDLEEEDLDSEEEPLSGGEDW
jgi:DNA-directed RNA polymerase subunit E'/Rpb7